jgi:hypothetical protein
VHDHVRAERQGLLQQWRRESVVDADDCPGVAAGGAQGGKVGNVKQRIRGGLQPEQVRAGDGGLDARGVGQINAVNGPAPLLPEYGLALPAALAVAGLRRVDAELICRLVRGGSEQSAFYTTACGSSASA